MKVFTFDEHYDAFEYNQFILNAKTNNIPFTEYILAHPPFYHCIEVNDNDLPKFLRYDTIKTQRYYALCSKIVPRYPEEAARLKRLLADGNRNITKFIENDVLKQAKNQQYTCVFKFTAKKIVELSLDIPSKIYLLGLKAGYRIGVCFNPFIQNLIPTSDIIVSEYKENLQNVGELEMMINNNYQPKKKLTHKTLVSAFAKDGKFFQIERPIIKFA